MLPQWWHTTTDVGPRLSRAVVARWVGGNQSGSQVGRPYVSTRERQDVSLAANLVIARTDFWRRKDTIYVLLGGRSEVVGRGNTWRWTSDGSMLSHRLRRWPNIDTALVQRPVFAGWNILKRTGGQMPPGRFYVRDRGFSDCPFLDLITSFSICGTIEFLLVILRSMPN